MPAPLACRTLTLLSVIPRNSQEFPLGIVLRIMKPLFPGIVSQQFFVLGLPRILGNISAN